MRLLDLYSGTGSVATVAREMGWDVTTLDISPKHGPDLCVDVLNFDYTVWLKHGFDLVFASVPCESYSQAKLGLYGSWRLSVETVHRWTLVYGTIAF